MRIMKLAILALIALAGTALTLGCASDQGIAASGGETGLVVEESADPALVDDDNDGYTADEDCDDSDAGINPGATELCNEIDDDCDGEVDEGDAAPDTWYADQDADNFGDPEVWQVQCDAPAGYVASDEDCDDTDPAINPGAEEVINGLDDDCDGVADVGAVDEESGEVFEGYACSNGEAIADPAGMAWVAGTVRNDPEGSGATFWVDTCDYLGEGQAYGVWIPEGTSLDVARSVGSAAYIAVLTGDLCANEDVEDGLEHYWHNPEGCAGAAQGDTGE